MTDSIRNDFYTINSNHTFKEILEKLHGNLKKLSDGFDYKEYLAALSDGFTQNDWTKLEKKIFDTLEQALGAKVSDSIAQNVINLIKVSSRHPAVFTMKAVFIGLSTVGADTNDLVQYAIHGLPEDIKVITNKTIEKMIQEDIENKRALGEALDAYNKALQTPINPSIFPMFVTPPNKDLVIALLKAGFERNFNQYLENPSLTAPSNTDRDHLSTVQILTLSQSGTLLGGKGHDHLSDSLFSDVIIGGAGNDMLYGGEGNDELFGNENNDTLFGGLGNDYLQGDAGDDRLEGKEGNDTLFGQNGNDILLGNEGDDKLYGREGVDHLQGDEGADQLYGEAGDDKLFGMDGDDVLHGGKGDDLLEGREGNDILHGGKGNDVLAGGEGADICHFTLGDGSDTIVDNSLNNTLTLSKVDHKNLWFTQKYSHLDIHIRDSDEKIQFQNWFKQPNSSNKIIAGDKQVTYQQVVSLVSAMAAFSPPKSGDSPLADNLQQQLNTIWLSVPQNS